MEKMNPKQAEAREEQSVRNGDVIGRLGTTRFGRWTVSNQYILVKKGERKWLCRCECGVERYVLERSLKSGASVSCGCLRKEKAIEAIAKNLAGQTFGELTVLEQADRVPGKRGIWWKCRCSCGNELEVLGTLMVNGRKLNCGGPLHEKNYAYVDITGKRFHRLTAMYRVRTKMQKNNSVIWHCRCDCGNEVDYSYNELVYTAVRSCGCQKKEHDQKLKSFLTHMAGTSLEAIRNEHVPNNNTTGYRGVYLIRGRYVAKIVFQKKQYFLGSYERAEEAAEARKEAEQVLFGETVQFYEKWKARAELDPEWAMENPVDIQVYRDFNGRLRVQFFPLEV